MLFRSIRESGDALVIIEGLTMYLSEADVQRIFDVIARRFPRVTVLVEEHSLTEGMAEFLPIYKVLGKIPLVRNISNRIVVLQK